MKPELMFLLWAVALTVAQMLIATIGAQLQVGLPTLAANRERMVEYAGWAGRGWYVRWCITPASRGCGPACGPCRWSAW